MCSTFRYATEGSGESHDTLDMVGIHVIEKAEKALSRTSRDYALD